MRFHQRQVSAAEAPRGRRWRPGQTGSPTDQPDAQPVLDMPRPVKSDHYVTIDEQLEGVVSVVAAPWPTVDANGLRFDGDITSTWFDAADLQATVDEFRAATDQLLRPLRIGDTFWVQRTTNPVGATGTVVTINDTAPTADRYNLTLCEILAGG